MAVGMETFGAALTGVANLKAAPEEAKNKLGLILVRPHRRAGLSLDTFVQGYTPVKRHQHDLQRRQAPFLQAMTITWNGANMFS